MRKLFILLIISCFTLSVNATECTDYLAKNYKQEFGVKKIKVKSKKEDKMECNQLIGNDYIKMMIYGTGYLKRPKVRKNNITYKCTIDTNNNIVWGTINF